MAMGTHTTTATDVTNAIFGAPTGITGLYAMRAGLVALADQLEEAEGEGADARLTRALEELWRIDNEILGKPPMTIADIRCQAAIVRHYLGSSNDPMCDKLLANIEIMDS